jgi:dihydroxyacetone synthase
MAPSVAATESVSGHGAGLDKQPNVPAQVSSAGEEKLVLNTIRCLAADLCQQVSPSYCMG